MPKWTVVLGHSPSVCRKFLSTECVRPGTARYPTTERPPNVVLAVAGQEMSGNAAPYPRVRLKTRLDAQPTIEATYFSTSMTSSSAIEINIPIQVAFSKYSSRARYLSTSGPEIKPFVINTSTPAQ